MPPQQGPVAGNIAPPAPGAVPAPGQPQPYRQLKVEDALAYLDQVKMKFEKQPHIYNKVRAHEHASKAPVPRAGLDCRRSLRNSTAPARALAPHCHHIPWHPTSAKLSEA